MIPPTGRKEEERESSVHMPKTTYTITHAPIKMHMYTHTQYVCAHMHMHMYIPALTYMYVQPLCKLHTPYCMLYTHTHTHTHTHAHTHMHTHTPVMGMVVLIHTPSNTH